MLHYNWRYKYIHIYKKVLFLFNSETFDSHMWFLFNNLIPLNIKVLFLSFLCHGGYFSKHNLTKRYWHWDRICDFFYQLKINHLFLDCPIAWVAWCACLWLLDDTPRIAAKILEMILLIIHYNILQFTSGYNMYRSWVYKSC
jgi:hypothetical protein